MAKFNVTVPVIIHLTIKVDAEDAESAAAADLNLRDLCYRGAGGSIEPTSPSVGISPPINDNVLWDKIEVEASDE